MKPSEMFKTFKQFSYENSALQVLWMCDVDGSVQCDVAAALQAAHM